MRHFFSFLFLTALLLTSCAKTAATIEEQAVADTRFLQSSLAEEILTRWAYDEVVEEQEQAEEEALEEPENLERQRDILEMFHRELADHTFEK